MGSLIFIAVCGIIIVACKLLVAACGGAWIHDQGSNLGPLHWEHSLSSWTVREDHPSPPVIFKAWVENSGGFKNSLTSVMMYLLFFSGDMPIDIRSLCLR